MKGHSTVQVAKLLGIGNDTLHRWIHERKVRAPKIQLVGGVRVRLWTETDIERARKYKNEFFWGKGTRRVKRRKPSK